MNPFVLLALGVGGWFAYTQIKKSAPAQTTSPVAAPAEKSPEEQIKEQAKEAAESAAEIAKGAGKVAAALTAGGGAAAATTGGGAAASAGISAGGGAAAAGGGTPAATTAAGAGAGATALAVAGVVLAVAEVTYITDRIKAYNHSKHKREDYKEAAIQTALQIQEENAMYGKLFKANNQMHSRLITAAWKLGLDDLAVELKAQLDVEKERMFPPSDQAWDAWVAAGWTSAVGERKPESVKSAFGTAFSGLGIVDVAIISSLQAGVQQAFTMSKKARKKEREMYRLLYFRTQQLNILLQDINLEAARSDRLKQTAQEMAQYEKGNPHAVEQTAARRALSAAASGASPAETIRKKTWGGVGRFGERSVCYALGELSYIQLPQPQTTYYRSGGALIEVMED